jgi:hypothetical protein
MEQMRIVGGIIRMLFAVGNLSMLIWLALSLSKISKK